MYDVIIVGAGPAGMSAALTLARSRRKIIVLDDNRPRNRWATAVHGYLSRDGIAPEEFAAIGREQLAAYGIEVVSKRIAKAEKVKNVFTAMDEEGHTWQAKKMLLATGLSDNIPQIKGLMPLYGKYVHHCPYCDGWENRDKKVVTYGKGKAGYGLAMALLNWTPHVTLCTDGAAHLRKDLLQNLHTKGIAVVKAKVKELVAEEEKLKKLVLVGGEEVECDALFFSTGYKPAATLHEQLGCAVTKKGEIVVDKLQQSSVEGLYVSGDAALEMKMAIIAAGEGAKAGIAINIALMKEED